MTDAAEQLIPFVGLRPFDTGDHRWFHGRDREIAALLRKVRNNRFTAVVGASGSGKSSLVRAGILVPLADDGWQTIIAKPGSAPIAKLATALSETAGGKLAETRTFRYDAMLRQSAYGLAEISQQLESDASRLVLVIDQFEELFRYGEEAHGAEKAAMEEESRAFVELLLTAASHPSGRLHIILTMRSDFFGNCAAYEGLAEAVSASQYLVPLPRRDQMHDIIRKPILDAGGAIDETLLQRLLLEVAEQTDHLPALQHTLRRLWEMAPVDAGKKQLSEADYQTIGGIAGSVDFKAEQIAAELKQTHPEDFATLERLMKAITDLDEQGRATRRPQKRSALLELLYEAVKDHQKAEASLDRVLKALASEEVSFIQLGGGDDPEVDIGHEALIHSWRRLSVLEFAFVAAEGEKVNLDSSHYSRNKPAEKRSRIGWLAEEREDGRYWKDLLRREKNKLGLHLKDALHARSWIKEKKVGPAWASRYGDAWETVHQFIRKSLIKNAAIAGSMLFAITVILTISIGLAWMNYELAQNNAKEALKNLEQAKLQEVETIRQARAGALAAAGYARSMVDEGQARLGALIALSVVPESRRSDDLRYVDEVGDVLRSALIHPIEIMRLQQSESIYSIAISPNGKRIVTGSRDGTLYLRDAQTGKLLNKITGHKGTVYSVVFSPDGLQIASGGQDGILRLWDMRDDALNEKFSTEYGGQFYSIAFSSDGSRIVTGNWDNTLQIWDVKAGLPLGESWLGHQDSVMSVAFSPDDKHIVSGSKNGGLFLWEVASGKKISQASNSHRDAIMSVAFSSDGRKIVSGSKDRTLQLWDRGAFTPHEWTSLKSLGERLIGHQDAVMTVAFLPGNSRVISGSLDKTLRIWDVQTSKPIGEPLKGHEKGVLGVASSLDGRRLVSGGLDNTLRLWNIEINRPIGESLKGHENRVYSVAFSPDGRRVVSGGDDRTLRLWDVKTGKQIDKLLQGHEGGVLSVAFSPDGRRIVSGSIDRTVRLWDVETGKPIGEPLKGHENRVYSVAFSPDGRRVVSGSSDRTLRVWDVETGQPIGEPLHGHEARVLSVAFSPDGRRMVSGSSDRTLRVWDVETGKPIGEPLHGHEARVLSVAFSPDGRRVVSGSSDRTLRVWDVETGQLIGESLRGHEGGVSSAAFSPDGRRVVSGSSDRTLRVWNVETGKPIGESLRGHEGGVSSVAFSPDGRRVVSGSSDRTLRLWDVETGKLIGEPLRGHEDGVNSVAFSPDGRRIVSGSSDHTLWLWDAGLSTASLQELVEKAEQFCPLSHEERLKLHLVDPLAEATQKPLTAAQRRACGE